MQTREKSHARLGIIINNKKDKELMHNSYVCVVVKHQEVDLGKQGDKHVEREERKHVGYTHNNTERRRRVWNHNHIATRKERIFS